MAGTWSDTFPGTPASARLARRFVEEALTGDGKHHLVDTALLLVSELVTNALLHASSGVTLVVSSDDEGATIEVHDGSPVFPAVRRYGLDAATGRGLLLVEDLSTAWDVEATDTGKKIWFELRSTDNGDGDSALGAALLAGLDLGDLLDTPTGGTSERPEDHRRPDPSDPRLTEGVRRG